MITPRILVLLLLALLCSGCQKKKKALVAEREDRREAAERRRRDRRQAAKQEQAALTAASEIIRQQESRPELCERVTRQLRRPTKRSALFHGRGICLERQGKLPGAIRAYRKAAELSAHDRGVQESLALACFRTGDLKCWTRAYRKLNRYRGIRVTSKASSPPITYFEPAGVKAEAESKQDVLVRKGINEARAGRVGAALDALRASLAEDVNHLSTLVNLAMVHAVDGKPRRGMEYLDRALTILQKSSEESKPTPTVLALRLARAIIFHRSARLRKALEEYKILLRMKPGHELALYGLGGVQSLLGKKNEALDTYHKLKQTGSKRAAALFQIIMRDG